MTTYFLKSLMVSLALFLRFSFHIVILLMKAHRLKKVNYNGATLVLPERNS